MADMSDIRDAACQVLAPLVGTGDGKLRAVLPYAPQQFAPLPLAYFGQARLTSLTAGQKEVWRWRLPLTVLMVQLGDFEQEMRYLTPFMGQIQGLIRLNLSLNDTIDSFRLTDADEGILSVGGIEYVGFTMYFDVVDKQNVVYRHH